MADTRRVPWLAAAIGAPIGLVGGLIGLGGAEFRLPFLKTTFRFDTRRTIALNLAISFVTLLASLALRLRSTSLDALAPLAPVIVAVAGGAMIGAYAGIAYANRVATARLERLVFMLLIAMGIALIVEAFLPEGGGGMPDTLVLRVPVAAGFGLAIGAISSLLGVAGGEMLIPMLLFAFGVTIKLAGTASTMISLSLVSVGCWKHARAGAYRERTELWNVVIPMGAASIVGALIGAQFVPYVSARAVKVLLGVILIWSAMRIFRHARPA